MSSRIINFSDGFSSSSIPTGASGTEEYIVANNSSGVLFTLNNLITKCAFIDYTLTRTSTYGSFVQAGSMIAVYDTTWTISFGNFHGDDIIQQPLVNIEDVSISINSSTGEVSFASGNMTGTGYVGNFKINITRVS